MENERIKSLANLLVGLKRYEWSRLKIAIEQMYDSASCKIALDDAERIQKKICFEVNGFYYSQQSESSTDEGDNHAPDTGHECSRI